MAVKEVPHRVVRLEAVRPEAGKPFKAGSLEELLETAAKLQRVAAVMGSMGIYELEAMYDVFTGDWRGQLADAALA